MAIGKQTEDFDKILQILQTKAPSLAAEKNDNLVVVN